MQQTSIFSKKRKTRITAKTYKNDKNECYKIESKHFFRTTLIVWFFLVCISLSFLIFQPNCFQNKNVLAAYGSCYYLDVLFDLGCSESELSGLDTFLSNSNELNLVGTYMLGSSEINLPSSVNIQKYEGKLLDGIQYTGDYNFCNATLVIENLLFCDEYGLGSGVSNVVLTSLDVTLLTKYLSSPDIKQQFCGFKIVAPTDDNVVISGNIVTSSSNYLPCAFTCKGNYGATNIGYGCILQAVWGEKVTTSNTTITSTVTGVNNSAVFIYIMSASGTTSQYALVGNASIALTQNIGDTITILVSKPYMWSMTVSGDCTQDSANKCKISYTVTNVDKNIALTFSGGAASSVIVI